MKPTKPATDSPVQEKWWRSPGLLYFIGAGHPAVAVKIGVTTQQTFLQRFRSLQSANHELLELLGAIPFDRGEFPMKECEDEERRLHLKFGHLQRFKAHTRAAEWFATSPELLAYIIHSSRPPEEVGFPRTIALPTDIVPTNGPTTKWSGQYLRVQWHDGWEYVERTHARGVVVIASMTDDRRVILIEQHRVPVGASVLEMPAGLIGDGEAPAGESLEDAARRELEEETGYRAERITHLISGPATAGLTPERYTFVLGEGLIKVGDGGGVASENITVYEVPLQEVDAWIARRIESGLLVDPKVYIGLYFLKRAAG